MVVYVELVVVSLVGLYSGIVDVFLDFVLLTTVEIFSVLDLNYLFVAMRSTPKGLIHYGLSSVQSTPKGLTHYHIIIAVKTTPKGLSHQCFALVASLIVDSIVSVAVCEINWRAKVHTLSSGWRDWWCSVYPYRCCIMEPLHENAL